MAAIDNPARHDQETCVAHDECRIERELIAAGGWEWIRDKKDAGHDAGGEHGNGIRDGSSH